MKIYSVLKRSVGCSQINSSQNYMCMAWKPVRLNIVQREQNYRASEFCFIFLVPFGFSFFFFLALFLIKQTKHRYTHKYFITQTPRNERVHTNKLVCSSCTIRVDIDIAIDLYCIYSSVSNSFSHTNSNLKIMQMEEMQKLTQKKSKHTYEQTQALAYK